VSPAIWRSIVALVLALAGISAVMRAMSPV
jgi:hypothetical protein